MWIASTNRRDRWCVLSISTALVFALAALSASPATGGDGVVNVNQHKTQPYVPDPQIPDDSCTNLLTGCNEGQQTPENDLGGYGLVDANAYHVGTTCKLTNVRCKYEDFSKSKVVSTDDGGVNPVLARSFMTTLAARTVGQFHFEWWDKCLTLWALSNNSVPPASDPPPPFSTFFPDSSWCQPRTGFSTGSQEMLEWIGNPTNGVVSESATTLLQNGWLHRDPATPRRLKWKAWDPTLSAFKDDFKRLQGFGYMGALGAGPQRLLVEPYMRELRLHNINFTRVWAIEQWTALRVPEGPTPFFGSHGPDGYHLDQDNSVFYNHLRNFAQQAADRGIAVQLSLFDKHGLIHDEDIYGYLDSPYRDDNNSDPTPEWLENTIPDCDAALGEIPHPLPPSDEPSEATCHPLVSFTTNARMQIVHRRFLRCVGEEVGGIGNMMFEVINEALAPAAVDDEDGDWPASTWSPRLARTTSRNQAWQAEMAAQMRLALPLPGVARDAFNGDDGGTALNGKAADVSGLTWLAENARVKAPTSETGGLGPARKLGYATSNAESGRSSMSASLPFASSSSWTRVQVRADVTVTSGQATIGFSNGYAYGLSVTLDVPSSQITLTQVGGCPLRAVSCPLGSASIASPSSLHNLRLKVEQDTNPTIWHVTVFLDGLPVSGLQNITTGPFGTVAWAFFYGFNGSTPYPIDAAKIDNFEAARFCDDEGRGCTP
ncbi:MAG: hypothetical protein AMXMBFR36_30540 [Acidobacteriota bacterium]